MHRAPFSMDFVLPCVLNKPFIMKSFLEGNNKRVKGAQALLATIGLNLSMDK